MTHQKINIDALITDSGIYDPLALAEQVHQSESDPCLPQFSTGWVEVTQFVPGEMDEPYSRVYWYDADKHDLFVSNDTTGTGEWHVLRKREGLSFRLLTSVLA